MLDEATRTTILKLKAAGHGTRAIAKALGVSRISVRRVIVSGDAARPRSCAPRLQSRTARRSSSCTPATKATSAGCTKSFSPAALSSPTPRSPPSVASTGSDHPRRHLPDYEFPAGKEMQHDTSPHVATIGGEPTRVQIASIVLCYSRMIFFQHYPRFTRFVGS